MKGRMLQQFIVRALTVALTAQAVFGATAVSVRADEPAAIESESGNVVVASSEKAEEMVAADSSSESVVTSDGDATEEAPVQEESKEQGTPDFLANSGNDTNAVNMAKNGLKATESEEAAKESSIGADQGTKELDTDVKQDVEEPKTETKQDATKDAKEMSGDIRQDVEEKSKETSAKAVDADEQTNENVDSKDSVAKETNGRDKEDLSEEAGAQEDKVKSAEELDDKDEKSKDPADKKELLEGEKEDDELEDKDDKEKDEKEEKEELKYPEQEFEQSASGLVVSVVAPEGAFPEDTTMKLESVDDKELLDKAIETANLEDAEVKAANVFFYNADDEEIKPEKSVQVILRTEELDEKKDVTLVRISDDGRATVVKKAVDVKELEYSFETKNFYTYAVVTAEPASERNKMPEQKFDAKANGIKVMVEAPEGAFPEGTIMEVRKVDDRDVLKEAVEKASENADAPKTTDEDDSSNKATRAKAVAVDISFYVMEEKDGEEVKTEIEPKASIKVTLKAEEIAQSENTTIVHVDDENKGTVIEETTTTEETKDEVSFEVDQFSAYAIVYTVDFSYGEHEFSIEGASTIMLSDVLQKLQIEDNDENDDDEYIVVGDVEKASFSDDTLVKITGFEDGDWKLESLMPFTSEETLTLTLKNGDPIKIIVTDDQEESGPKRRIFIKDNAGWSATVYRIHLWGNDNLVKDVVMTPVTIGWAQYYYCEIDESVISKMTGFLFHTGDEDDYTNQTADITDDKPNNGQCYVIKKVYNNGVPSIQYEKTTIQTLLGISSRANESFQVVDMHSNESVSKVFFRNIFNDGESKDVEKNEEGKFTIPSDNDNSVPYTQFSLDGKQYYDIPEPEKLAGNNIFYYGATTEGEGANEKVIANYWGSENGTGELANKTLYVPEAYQLVDNGDWELQSNEEGGSEEQNSLNEYKFKGDAQSTQSTILAVKDENTNMTYRFFWNDTSKDMLSITDEIAKVDRNYGNRIAISNADDLRDKLSAGDSGSYYLTNDIEYNGVISTNKDIIFDLNGHSINHSGEGNGKALFEVNGGKFILCDSQETEAAPDSTQNESEELFAANENTVTLKWYVTEPTIEEGISTVDTRNKYKHTDVKGKIYTTQNSGSLIKIASGAEFVLDSGFLTGNKGQVKHLVTNDGTFVMNGGYLAGANAGTEDGGAVYSTGSFVMNGGVIAANKARNGGGVYIGPNGKFTLNGGVISGNSIDSAVGIDEAAEGFGAGVYANHARVEVKGGYITNNSNTANCGKHIAYDHGGGGIAVIGGHMTMSGGYITGNKANEAGGGLYISHANKAADGTVFDMTGGIVASNSVEDGEGGGMRISANALATLKADDKIYITNNTKKTNHGWGGGGIFVQEGGTLNLYESLITANTAGGFGGGFAACPSGDANSVSNDGAAIFGNTASGTTMSDATSKDKDKQLKNNNTYYKNATPVYEKVVYNDYFSAGNAVIGGTMLGDTSANWSGVIDAYGSSEGTVIDVVNTQFGLARTAKENVGLTANPKEEDKNKVINLAKVIISGNTSADHGGGIMTNGIVKLGTVSESDDLYPGFTLTAKKKLTINGEDASEEVLESKGYQFELIPGENLKLGYDSGSRKWQFEGAFAPVSIITVDGTGSIDFGRIEVKENTTYYLREVIGSDSDTHYDDTFFKIEVKMGTPSTQKVNDKKYITIYSIKEIVITKYEAQNDTGKIVGVQLSALPGTNGDWNISPMTADGVTTPTFVNTLVTYELPETGGAGTLPYQVGGIMLGIMALLLFERRKNYEGRAKK